MQSNLTCTIARAGRSDPYGTPLTAGSSYTGAADFVRALVQAGFATLSDPANQLRDDAAAQLAGVFAIAQSHVQIAAPNDTNENTLWSYTVPGGLMGPNDSLRVSALFGFGAGSSNNKVLRCKLGSFDFFNGLTVFNASHRTFEHSKLLRNRISSQVAAPNWAPGGDTNAPMVGAINTAQPQTLAITAQKAVAGDVITLESVLVELIRAAS